MKAQLIVALAAMTAAMLVLPAMAAPLQISGEYGSGWLANNGNKNVVKVPQSGNLWSWGTIPKGQYLYNGTLKPIGDTTIYYPSFLESNSPLYVNRTTNINGYFPPDFSSPYFMDDPWYISQLTGRPVVYRA